MWEWREDSLGKLSFYHVKSDVISGSIVPEMRLIVGCPAGVREMLLGVENSHTDPLELGTQF